MQRKAGYRIEHPLSGDIDRHVIGKPGQDRFQRINPLAGNQQRKGLMEGAVGQLFDDDLALCHEKAGAAHQVPLPYVAIDFDARIVEVVDLNAFWHVVLASDACGPDVMRAC